MKQILKAVYREGVWHVRGIHGYDLTAQSEDELFRLLKDQGFELCAAGTRGCYFFTKS